MRPYHERLVAPATWWLWSTGCVLMFGTLVWAGFSLTVGIAVYAVLEAGCAWLLLSWGAITIEVTSDELRVGSRRLPLASAGEVAALDEVQTRALRGPRADPAAVLVVRPYLPESVYVEVARPADSAGPPYWLIATRKPAELAAAIEAARPRAGQDPAWDDAAGQHVP
jgi:Protein of unknown function (DUF3093)